VRPTSMAGRRSSSAPGKGFCSTPDRRQSRRLAATNCTAKGKIQARTISGPSTIRPQLSQTIRRPSEKQALISRTSRSAVDTSSARNSHESNCPDFSGQVYCARPTSSSAAAILVLGHRNRMAFYSLLAGTK